MKPYIEASFEGEVVWLDTIWGGGKSLSKEKWAVEGKSTDSQPDRTVVCNPGHFSVVLWSECHFENGEEKFNISRLGRWRDPVVWSESGELAPAMETKP